MQRKTECKETYVYELRRTHHAHRSRRSLYAKRPKETYTYGKRPIFIGKLRAKRPMYMQRDALITHTAYGGAGMQRDLHVWKETYIYRKSVCKETYVYTKRPMYMKRDAHIIHTAHGEALDQKEGKISF